METDEIGPFSQHCGFQLVMKGTVFAESSYFINIHRDLSTPAMSTDISQVGVALYFSMIQLLKCAQMAG